MEGFLLKKGEKGLVKGWKKRYFRFDEQSRKLFYSEGKGTQPLGNIDCSAILSIDVVETGKPGLFDVSVLSGRVFQLDAGDAASRKLWMEALNDQTGMKRQDVAPIEKKPPETKKEVEAEAEAEEKNPEEVLLKNSKKRQRVCEEILQTETAYLDQLSQLVTCYEEPLLKAGVMNDAEKRGVFINVRVLVQIHQELLDTLKAKMESENNPGEHYAVGAALCSISPLLTFYKDYVNKYHDAGHLLRKLSERKKFAQVLEKCKHSGSSGGLNSLENLMVVPVQRIPRYVLLLKEVLKFTPDSHPDHCACRTALEKLETVGSIINEARRQFENAGRLLQIANLMQDSSLIEAHRKLLVEYPDMSVRSSKLNTPGEAAAFESRTLLLCTDALVVMRRDVESERLLVEDLASFQEAAGSVFEENVAEDLISVATTNGKKMLHTIRVDAVVKKQLSQALRTTMTRWREDARLFAQQEKVTEELEGVKFKITGNVPVSPAGGKAYVMYIISAQKDSGKPKEILKRYSELLKLHRRLVQIYGESGLPKFPTKKLAGDVAKVAATRQPQLEEYLNALPSHGDFLKVPEVRRFFTTSAAAGDGDDAPRKSPRFSSGKSPRLSKGGSSRSSPMLSRGSSRNQESSNATEVVSVFAKGNPADIVCEGWLTKKGHKRRNWKRRWMILRDGEVCYYAKKGASEPKGVIELLQPGVSSILMENSAASNFRFMIITPDQIYPLYADTDEERKQWMDAVAQFAEQEEDDDMSTATLRDRGATVAEVMVWGDSVSEEPLSKHGK